MTPQPSQKSTSARLTSLFLVGFGLFLLTRRSELVPTIPIAIAIAPIFILRFSRSLPTRRAMLLTLLGFVLSMNIALWGLFEVSDALLGLVFNVARNTALALLYATPYLIDRVMVTRLGRGFWVTLVFPVAVTAVMFLASLEGPFDGTVGKTIYAAGPLALLQLYSVTGLWGFVFLWSWLAALVSHAWDAGFAAWPSTRAALAFVLAAGAILAYGGYRLSASPDAETVKVAAVVLLPEDGKVVSMERLNAEKLPRPYEETLSRIEALTSRAVAGGAKIVTFQEFAMTVLAPDVDRLRAVYTRIAAENRVWLSITYAWYADEGKGANRHLLIDDQGQIRADYQKRFLLGFGPFGETAVFSKGPEVIQVVDSPYGRIAVSICRDMSFPAYARQAGRNGADIMLTPAYDFPRSKRPSDYGRAIESGFTHIRPTYNGVSYAASAHGRILARMDSDLGGTGIMYAEVPVRGERTLYARYGDWFGWSNVAALVVFGISAVTRRRTATRAPAHQR